MELANRAQVGGAELAATSFGKWLTVLSGFVIIRVGETDKKNPQTTQWLREPGYRGMVCA